MSELTDYFDNLSGNVSKEVEIAITKAVILVETDAKMHATASVDTGLLRSSITRSVETEDGSIVGYVGTNVEYAPYIEFGTSKARAQPYLTPALDQNRATINRMILDAISKGMQ